METHIYLPSNFLTMRKFNGESVNSYVFCLRIFGEEDMVRDIRTEESGNNEGGENLQ